MSVEPIGSLPRAITPSGPPPFVVGDVVTVSSPVDGETVTYEGIVSGVAPISSVLGSSEAITWLIDVYSPTWIPARLRQAAYSDADGTPDPGRATLTLIRHGQWPPGASADSGNRLTLGTDGGLYLGPEA